LVSNVTWLLPPWAALAALPNAEVVRGNKIANLPQVLALTNSYCARRIRRHRRGRGRVGQQGRPSGDSKLGAFVTADEVLELIKSQL